MKGIIKVNSTTDWPHARKKANKSNVIKNQLISSSDYSGATHKYFLNVNRWEFQHNSDIPYSGSSEIMISVSTLAWMIWPSVLRLTVPLIPIKQCSCTLNIHNHLFMLFIELPYLSTGIQQHCWLYKFVNEQQNSPPVEGFKYFIWHTIFEINNCLLIVAMECLRSNSGRYLGVLE